jgi:predicted transcriptional regulator
VLNEVSSKYSRYLAPGSAADTGKDEEYVRIIETDWYKGMSRTMTPGRYLKILREACGHTLTEIGEKIGVSAARVCDYEAGRREMSKAVAKKLSKIFLVPAEKFI